MDNHKSTIINHKLPRAFTLIELIVTMGVFVIIMGFSAVAYLNIQRNSDLTNQSTQLVSSLRQAQALAISGQTLDDATNTNVGIHFEENNYTLFITPIYDPLNDKNIVTNLPNEVDLDYNLPSQDLIFVARTGEVNSFDPTKNYIKVVHQNGDFKTINFNKLGVVNIL